MWHLGEAAGALASFPGSCAEFGTPCGNGAYFRKFPNSQKSWGNWVWANIVYQALFFSLPTHENLWTRLHVFAVCFCKAAGCLQSMEGSRDSASWFGISLCKMPSSEDYVWQARWSILGSLARQMAYDKLFSTILTILSTYNRWQIEPLFATCTGCVLFYWQSFSCIAVLSMVQCCSAMLAHTCAHNALHSPSYTEFN